MCYLVYYCDVLWGVDYQCLCDVEVFFCVFIVSVDVWCFLMLVQVDDFVGVVLGGCMVVYCDLVGWFDIIEVEQCWLKFGDCLDVIQFDVCVGWGEILFLLVGQCLCFVN